MSRVFANVDSALAWVGSTAKKELDWKTSQGLMAAKLEFVRDVNDSAMPFKNGALKNSVLSSLYARNGSVIWATPYAAYAYTRNTSGKHYWDIVTWDSNHEKYAEIVAKAIESALG